VTTSGTSAPSGTSGISGGAFTAVDRVVYVSSISPSYLIKDSTFLYHDTTNSRLGIGISPTAPFHISATSNYAGTFGTPHISLYGNNAIAADIGGSLMFIADYTTGVPTQLAAIAGYRENATSANSAGYLGFYTRTNGNNSTIPERMRIDSNGYVGIGGSPTTDGKLYVSADSANNKFLELANCNGLPTSTSAGRTLKGYIRIKINTSVKDGASGTAFTNNGGIGGTTNDYYIPVYS
jgi:hypothetical protein